MRRLVLINIPLYILMHTLYRVRAHGMEYVPQTGTALLVGNHISYIDPLVIMIAMRRRVRFLVWAPYARLPFLRLILSLANTIPIDGRAGPRAIIQALRTASEALANGEVVCI